MAAGALRPGAYAIVGADEVVACEDGIVTIGVAENDIAVDAGATVAAPMVGAQRIGERARGRGEERRWKGSRGAFGEEGETRVKAEGEHGKPPALTDVQEVVIRGGQESPLVDGSGRGG